MGRHHLAGTESGNIDAPLRGDLAELDELERAGAVEIKYASSKPHALRCARCGRKLGMPGEAFYGAGDGRGERFMCARCHEVVPLLR